jgi:BirA family biotin operon repressor/biotin-[acetyl-CoA-carboxylase] ligase
MAVSTRQALLQALSAAGGSYVSGQQLAETLGVSRAAVHKAAAALTAQGYALEAAPRRGYRLAGGDPFCTEAIGDYPAPIYLYDTLESSNRTAKLLALDGAPHGTLVLTAHQSAGRGRLGRKFESPAGKGVYCSVLLRPEMPAANAQTATISAAVAVCRAVKKLCGLELAVKWVNDLYYQGRKVCGILTEAGTDLESGQLEWLVVGIGLNLTSTAADWPEQGMQQLHDLGFKTAAMALTDLSVSIDDAALAAEPKLAIVLGTEGDGLAHTTIAACDYTVRIPMSHGVDSLNVAAASAVAFWQLGKQ